MRVIEWMYYRKNGRKWEECEWVRDEKHEIDQYPEESALKQKHMKEFCDTGTEKLIECFVMRDLWRSPMIKKITRTPLYTGKSVITVYLDGDTARHYKLEFVVEGA